MYLLMSRDYCKKKLVISTDLTSPESPPDYYWIIYKHPNMNINKFIDDYLNELLDKLNKENETIFLLGDFNIMLSHYDIHPPTNEFLDSLSSHYFLPYILPLSRVTTNSKTLIDNIFSNMAVPTASISDRLPQFFVASNIFFNLSYPRSNNYERISQDLIKNILYLIIYQLPGIIFCFYLTQTLKNPIKISFKSLSFYLKLMHL